MLGNIRRFLEDHLSADATTPQDSERHLQLATAVLLLEIARADMDTHRIELATVQKAITRTFRLSDDEVDQLMQMAKDEVRESTSDQQFTSLVNEGFDQADKARLVEMLWEVAYADGELDKYEEHLIRRIADLIYVPHREFIAAKLRVAERHGQGG
jgi:uncharacterized tellurite resistance protein B-like protein